MYPWVKAVQGESDKVFCDVCQSRFSVALAHGGELGWPGKGAEIMSVADCKIVIYPLLFIK